MARLVLATVAVGGAAYVAANTIYYVPAGHKAVIFNKVKGILPVAVDEGVRVKTPFLETAIVMDVQTRQRTVVCTTGTKDLQRVSVHAVVHFKPDATQLPRLYSILGERYDELVLPSLFTELAKVQAAQNSASQLVRDQADVAERVGAQLQTQAAKYHILVQDFSISEVVMGTSDEASCH